jgi:hypothetical protein
MNDFDRHASVMRACPAPANRLVFDADLSSHPIEQIQCGVVFIHAFWAGQSHRAIKRIADTLARVDPNGRLQFIVCDIDDIQQIPDWQQRFYAGDETGGNGDLLWIARGVIQARHNATRQCDFETTSRSLLRECYSK